MTPAPDQDEALFVPEEAMELTGVELPAMGEIAWEEMARCFIEEYVRMGCSRDEILRICRSPFYQGMHNILKFRGETFVKSLIDEAARAWRPRQAGKGGGDAQGL